MPEGSLLIVAAKAQPMSRTISGDVARALAAASLQDTVAAARSLPTRAGIAVMLALNGDAGDLPVTVRDLPAFVRSGNRLHERLVPIFEHGFELGFRSVCIVGTDTPHLPGAFLQEAFGRLSRRPHSIVLGPAENGGFYLAGAGVDGPTALFREMSRDADAVGRVTAGRAAEKGLALTLLPPWYAIDTPSGLRRLRRDLDRGVAFAAETEKTLRKLRTDDD